MDKEAITMKVTPMIFNGEMVRAILEDRKTQTRRPLILPSGWSLESPNGTGLAIGKITSGHPKKGRFGAFIRRDICGSGKFEHDIVCAPCGQPGDLIYVRETFGAGCRPCPYEGGIDGLEYRADQEYLEEFDCLPLYRVDDLIPDDVDCLERWMGHWTPAIHMPRWASRITLEITSVRAQRLQDISEEDAKAEGITAYKGGWTNGVLGPFSHPVLAFSDLWDSIYSNWNKNPWVWVIEFKPHMINVDAMLKARETDNELSKN